MFIDRKDAGKQLAAALVKYQKAPNTVVLGLARGGVVVAYEVAKALHLPLDVICPRKIGLPYNPELAMGAVTESGQMILNPSVIETLGVSDDVIREVAEKEKKRAIERLKVLRQGLPPRQLKGKDVILVDDGLATGATMKAAVQSMKFEGAATIIVAVPVSPDTTLEELQNEADEVVCLETPPFFQAIGQFYDYFDQVEDDEVVELLKK